MLITVSQADAQSIGIGTATPDPGAVLDVSGSKGLLLPRLTAAERDAENDQLKTALKTLQSEIEAIKEQLSQRQK